MNKKFKGIGWFLGAVLWIICLIPKISNPTEELQLLITYAVLTVIFIALGIRSMLRKPEEKKED